LFLPPALPFPAAPPSPASVSWLPELVPAAPAAVTPESDVKVIKIDA
jgi:hypothetical protein